MSGGDATWQYMTGQARPSWPALMEEYQRESDAVRLEAADVPYGPHPRQVFDVVSGQAPWLGTVAYYHPGYWQSRDKALFRFIALPLAAKGIDVALVNYPLCPDVTLFQLLQMVRSSVPAVLAHRTAAGRGGAALIAAGHSAGAHIAAELAMADWHGTSPIRGVVALSGVYDLMPLVDTALNDKLRLDARSASALSPLARVRAGLPPALFIVGGEETPAFLAQSADMHAAWRRAGNASQHLVLSNRDHYSVLREFHGASVLLRSIEALAVAASAEPASTAGG